MHPLHRAPVMHHRGAVHPGGIESFPALAALPLAGDPLDVTITALLFAAYAELLGRERLELTLSPGATVGDAVARIRALPGGARLPTVPLAAVNLAYAAADHVLAAGDELALIPPVAGG